MNPFATTIATIAIIAPSAFFVAAEFSMVNLDRADLEQRQAKGEAGLGTVQHRQEPVLVRDVEPAVVAGVDRPLARRHWRRTRIDGRG